MYRMRFELSSDDAAIIKKALNSDHKKIAENEEKEGVFPSPHYIIMTRAFLSFDRQFCAQRADEAMRQDLMVDKDKVHHDPDEYRIETSKGTVLVHKNIS